MDKFCKKIYNSKYERLNMENRKWWEKYFKNLERMEDWKEILKETLPSSLYSQLLKKFAPEGELTFRYSETELKTPPKLEFFCSDSKDSARSVVGTKSEIFPPNSKKSDIKTIRSNPYLNFFKRHPEDAAIWREDFYLDEQFPKKLSKIKEKNSGKLARNLIEVLNVLRSEPDGDNLQSIETANELLNASLMLEISKTITVKIQEKPSVPHQVALARKLPGKSRRAMLFSEIANDQRASRVTRNLMAFGKTLPLELQLPLPGREHERWLKLDHLPKNIVSMATIWDGINHLCSTKEFFQFMYEYHRHIKPPKYFEDKRLWNPKKLVKH